VITLSFSNISGKRKSDDGSNKYFCQMAKKSIIYGIQNALDILEAN
jgi:hypothetical protein